MSTELEILVLDHDMRQGLPLAYQRIMVSHEIMDEATTRAMTLALPKYGHASAFTRRPNKQISKPEL